MNLLNPNHPKPAENIFFKYIVKYRIKARNERSCVTCKTRHYKDVKQAFVV